MTIKEFKKIREDGKIIEESMTTKSLVEMGWKPKKVIAIEWYDNNQRISIQSPLGILAVVVPGRSFVALIKESDKFNSRKILLIVNQNGEIRHEILNVQIIQEQKEEGRFCWFEQSRIKLTDVFGVIFERTKDKKMFQLDFDAKTGGLVGVHAMR